MPERYCYESTTFFDVNKQENLEQFTANWIKNSEKRAVSRGGITIPIVVHIVYQSEAENITAEQVASQIDALNRDFNLQNENVDKVAPDFEDRIAKVGFKFCLASIDPDGQPSSGITRTATSEDNVFFRGANWIYHLEEGGQNAWDTEHYLNIWVTKTSDDNYLGFGTKPGGNAPNEDGVVVAAKYFGRGGSAVAPYHLGRTATHEIGHYFNLLHPWGAATNCEQDDFVKDTPCQSATYNGCPDPNSFSCDSKDITANFMNYSEDECLAMFTKGQAMRMQAALIGARKGLLESNACEEIYQPNEKEIVRIYPNPASYYFCIATNSEDLEKIPFRMLDTKGAVIQKGMVEPKAIQYFPTTQKGIYFLQFFVKDEEPIVKKIVVY